MRIHVLGICGTFMAGVARLARALGHEVEGSDAAAHPPMGEQLAADGIRVRIGYRREHLDPPPDEVLIGNALSRGNPAVEHVLDRDLPFDSGPGWLARHVLPGRRVLAIAGTHGKTTTASLLAHVLRRAGRRPGHLVGGVPLGLPGSAALGEDADFVIEADEYDSAFFDKRSKFIHYRPRVLVINNLEMDHADIFDDLAALRRQFHHVVRTVPGSGRLVCPAGDAEVDAVLAMGCWTPVERFGIGEGEWRAEAADPAWSSFTVITPVGERLAARWRLLGEHNARNALGAVAAAAAAGIEPAAAVAALAGFEGVRRRLEVRGAPRGITVYDDFAHHPSAIRATLEALRARVGRGARILALVDPASNTMRLGLHRAELGPALAAADEAWLHARADLRWDPAEVAAAAPGPVHAEADLERMVAACAGAARPGDHVVVMSNGAFGGVHERLLEALESGGDG